MRSTFLPYCLPWLGEEEIGEVVDCLRHGWLTTGPKVARFEEEFAKYVGARHAIAVHSCTDALHVTLAALGIGPGDEVIVPTLTFCATANVVVHLGARPVIVDVDEHYQISVEAVRHAITSKTRAIVPVHYAGQACDLAEILALADKYGLPVIEDAAHAAGSEYRGRRIGTHGRAVCFSFYATKNMTTGEGGMVTTEDDGLAQKIRRLALHGMSKDAWKRYTKAGSWYYEVLEPGYKYNMTDIQAALGIHQLRRLDSFIADRQRLARLYREAFADVPELILPEERPDRTHAYHLFPVRLAAGRAPLNRDQFIEELKQANIGTSVHFIPLHRHPAYRDGYGYAAEQFPVAEKLFEGLVSLPLYPRMSEDDLGDVVVAVRTALGREITQATPELAFSS